MMTKKCQCENAAHFPTDEKDPLTRRGHRYGERYSVKSTLDVRTTRGTFTVCQGCADACLGSLEASEEKQEPKLRMVEVTLAHVFEVDEELLAILGTEKAAQALRDSFTSLSTPGVRLVDVRHVGTRQL